MEAISILAISNAKCYFQYITNPKQNTKMYLLFSKAV